VPKKAADAGFASGSPHAPSCVCFAAILDALLAIPKLGFLSDALTVPA
jgi:hypothetical protein